MTRISCRRRAWSRSWPWPSALAWRTWPREHVRITRPCGVNAHLKVALPGGGHDRRGGQHRRHGPAAARRHARCCSAGCGRRPRWGRSCAPLPGGTCCSCRRSTGSSWRNWPAGPRCCPARARVAFLDIDSQQKRVYGHAKQGAAFGHTKIQGKSLLVRGLNVLAATVSTPLAAPVIAATRLRGGNAASARGAASHDHRSRRHRPRRRVHRHPGGADGLGVLRRRVQPCGRPPGRGALLRHRPDGPRGPGRDRRHQRRRLDADPLPPRRLG